MTDHIIVPGADAATGPRGEQLLAGTARVRLRLWEGEEAGEVAPLHRNAYDYAAYVVAGVLRVHITGAEATEVHPGDSYAVPAGVPYAFEVLQTAKVVEAVAPGDAAG
jgi:quercetin dioxygenase-like cupin family protein